MSREAVITSMKKRIDKDVIVIKIPLKSGAPKPMSDWMVPKRPLTRIRLFSGTSCGRTAPTAGLCAAVPNDLRVAAAKMAQIGSCLPRKRMDRHKVTRANLSPTG